jgi:hypothetical protein
VIDLGRLAVLAAGLLGSPAARHDVHVSHTRLVVEGATVAAQVRLFRDDVEKTFAARAGTPAFDVARAPKRDSLLGAYLDERFVLEGDGVRLRGTVEGSGIETDRDRQEVVWVLLDFPAAKPVASIRLRNVIFHETWADQQNIVQVLHLPDEARQTLYFAPGDGKAQELAF